MPSQFLSRAKFNILQLASTIDNPTLVKWIAESSAAFNQLGGEAIIPTEISRYEPLFRRKGAIILPETLEKSQRFGPSRVLRTVSMAHNIHAYLVYDLASLKIALRLTKYKRAPIAYVVTDDLPVTSANGFIRLRINPDRIDFFIVPSQYHVDRLLKGFNISRGRIGFVREGVDLSMTADQSISHERTASLAAIWGVVEEPSEIILIKAQYNQPDWRRFITNLFTHWDERTRPNAVFVFEGDDGGTGEMDKFLAQMIRNFPQIQTRFPGYCADIEAAIKLSSAVLIAPSYASPYLSTALTVQAMGRVIIAPDRESYKPLIAEALAHYAYDGDPYLCCEMIEQVISRTDTTRQGEAQSAREFICAHHSLESMRDALAHLFDSEHLDELAAGENA